MKYNKMATDKLNSLKRISFDQMDKTYESDVLLYEKNIKLFYTDDKI